MRRPDPKDGFQLCFALNLLWGLPWFIATVVLLILNITLGVPGVLWRLTSIVWVLIALIMTKLIEQAGKAASEEAPEQPNKNPYSAKTVFIPGAPPAPQASPLEAIQEAPSIPEDAPEPERLELDARELTATLEKLDTPTG